MTSATTLVLGIGNTLLSDEGIGIYIIRHLDETTQGRDDLELMDGGTLSFTLAEAISVHPRLIVVDAGRTEGPAGTLAVFEGDAMDARLRGGLQSVHEVSLSDLMDIARLTDSLPQRRALVAVQPDSLDWGDGPTPAVEASIPLAARAILKIIARWDTEEGGDRSSY